MSNLELVFKKSASRLKAIILIIIILFVLLICYLAYFYLQINAMPDNEKIEQKEILIESGIGTNEISAILYDQGIIDSKWNFELYLWLIKKEDSLQAGKYRLQNNLSIVEVARHLARGMVDKETEIKIIEGWTIRNIANYLKEKNIIEKEEFILKTEDFDYFLFLHTSFPRIMAFLDDSRFQVKSKSLEGFLFPDTYRIYFDSGPERIIYRMMENLDKKITDEMLSEIKAQNRTFYDVLILASIIEKEANNPKDMKIVADVFLKRLSVNMPLQACSTVNYVTGKSDPGVSLSDTLIDSPYNTYKYSGLPAGPISNPGLEAIKAAIYPTANDYWFFLTTPGGKMVYSENLDRHNEAKNKNYP